MRSAACFADACTGSVITAAEAQLAARLRTKWGNALTDEIYFRDTAHGFLAWAVATLVTAALLTSVIGSIVSGGAKAGASMVGGVAATTAATAAAGGAAINNAEKTPATGNGGSLDYFVDSLFRKNPNTAKARPARPENGTAAPSVSADKARKASAYSALWIFVSLLIGAFVASLTAIWGGRHRNI